MNLEEIKNKIAVIFNTKDIENIEDILSYDDLGKNIVEVLRAIQKYRPHCPIEEKPDVVCRHCGGADVRLDHYFGDRCLDCGKHPTRD